MDEENERRVGVAGRSVFEGCISARQIVPGEVRLVCWTRAYSWSVTDSPAFVHLSDILDLDVSRCLCKFVGALADSQGQRAGARLRTAPEQIEICPDGAPRVVKDSDRASGRQS